MKKVVLMFLMVSMVFSTVNGMTESLTEAEQNYQQENTTSALQKLEKRITKLEEKDIIGISVTAGTFILGIITGLVAMHIIQGKKSHGHVLGGK